MTLKKYIYAYKFIKALQVQENEPMDTTAPIDTWLTYPNAEYQMKTFYY